jgi:hypothetical protein
VNSREKEILQELEIRRCRNDEEYFMNTYCKIRVPGRGKIQMNLFPAQRETLTFWRENRYTIILKARQIGYTTLAALHSLHQALFFGDREIVMLSKKEEDAREILGKAAYAYKHLPMWMKRRLAQPVTNNMERMAFSNDSEIVSLPSKEDPARGRSVDTVIVDEWASLNNPEEAWASIEPIADVGGRVIGFSTAKGAGNFFHTLWASAASGSNYFKCRFYPWSAATWRTEEWYESKRESLPEWTLHQEYPTNADEAFIKSGSTVFDYDMLRKLPTIKPVRGRLQGDPLIPNGRSAIFIEDKKGPLRVWQEPQAGHPYVIGADTAEGLEHGDFSSAHVIDARTGDVVAKWHGKVDPDVFGREVLWRLGWWYNCALVGPEANNHGLSTCLALRNLAYPNIYWRHTFDQRSQRMTRKIGWRTDSVTKPMMIDELNQAVRDDAIHLTDSETIGELTMYVRDENGKMGGSPFDDQVISLAVAQQMLKFAYDQVVEPEHSDYMTWNWLEREIQKKEGRDGGVRVGMHNRRDWSVGVS